MSGTAIRLLGLDPGLRTTGWGVIEADGNRLVHVADGAVRPPAEGSLAARLAALRAALARVIDTYRPDEAAVEETFVNRNPASALRLGQARGVVLLAPAEAGLPVSEYPANLIKKSIVGAGHADKNQIAAMVRALLSVGAVSSFDASDALAVAICHAHHRATRARVAPFAREEER